MGKAFYTIGQMAALCGLTIQTLRHYDRIGLLVPSRVGQANRYRYYTDEAIRRLRIIQDLKASGLSLDEIGRSLELDNLAELRELFVSKREECQRQMAGLQATLNRIERRITNLDLCQEAPDSLVGFAQTIELKQLPDRKVVFTRKHSASFPDELSRRFSELERLAEEQGLPCVDSRMAVYHDFHLEHDPSNCDLEVCMSLATEEALSPCIRTIPGGLFVTGIYRGEYRGQCRYLLDWIRQNGLRLLGPGIEIYVNSFMHTRFPRNYLTEVQFPVTNLARNELLPG